MRIEISFEIPDAVVRAAPVTALVLLLAVWLAIRIRRRRIEERKLRIMSSISHDLFTRSEHPAIEEFRREVDASHRRYELSLLEERWKQDGSILLERKAAP